MGKKGKNINHLSPAKIGKFKALLLAKRNELLGNVSSMEIEALRRESSDLSKLPIHMADLGTDNYDQEFTLGLVDSERKLVKKIDEALGRIANGTYGICEGNGNPISKARLEAIPWARYSVEYASLLEKGVVKKDFSSPDTGYNYEDDEQDDDSRSTFRRTVE